MGDFNNECASIFSNFKNFIFQIRYYILLNKSQIIWNTLKVCMILKATFEVAVSTWTLMLYETSFYILEICSPWSVIGSWNGMEMYIFKYIKSNILLITSYLKSSTHWSKAEFNTRQKDMQYICYQGEFTNYVNFEL
jgi:hypothetical protein